MKLARYSGVLALVFGAVSVTTAAAGFPQRVTYGRYWTVEVAIHRALGWEHTKDVLQQWQDTIGERMAELRQDRPRSSTEARLLAHELELEAMASARAQLVDELRPVISGELEPATRSFEEFRFKEYSYPHDELRGETVRDALLGVERRGDLRAILARFQRYSREDRERVGDLEEVVGKHRLAEICEEATTWAGIRRVRAEAAIVVSKFEDESVDTDSLFEATRERFLPEAVDRARQLLLQALEDAGQEVPESVEAYLLPGAPGPDAAPAAAPGGPGTEAAQPEWDGLLFGVD